MANLSDLIQKKIDFFEYERLETGNISTYAPQGYPNYCNNIKWVCVNSGKMTVEIWGSGGSGAEMCCCGVGLPGNPGAYARKTFYYNAGDYLCGYTGKSCANATDLCFRGCSEASCFFYISSDPRYQDRNWCMCAQGGRGGVSYCSTTTSGVCCFGGNGYCRTICGDRCGIACNYHQSCMNFNPAQAYGGDVNCPGSFSCTVWHCYHPNRPCNITYSISGPPGVFSDKGVKLNFPIEENVMHSNWSGNGPFQYVYALNGASKMPSGGGTETRCWTGGRHCGCYEHHGCIEYVPPGFPGLPPSQCSGVRDHATRGGSGMVRIKFVPEGEPDFTDRNTQTG